MDHAANALAFVHQVEGLVDVFQAHGVGDDGIQDYEKARIVMKALKEKNDQKAIDSFQTAINKMEANQRFDGWNEELNNAKTLLNDLSRSL